MSHPEHAPAPDPTLTVEFADSLVPQITAGRYTLTAHQTLTRNGARADEDGYLDPPARQEIEVRAPRFTVQPEWIHGAYPTPGATGLYDDVLPHVTLDRPTLPWERDEGTAPGGARLPWLALLVLGEGELPGDPHCLGQTEPRTVQDLLGTEPGVVLPAFDQAADPVADDDKATVCRTIRVPRAVFHSLAPTAAELPLLTHVRTVDEQHQGVTLSEDRVQAGDYAVVVGNRLPRAAGGRYVAHLVSLEGWQSRLPDGTQEAYSGPDETLRLISLWSWSFETIPDHAPGFAALTEHFVDTEGDRGSGLLLRVPLGERPVSGADQQEVADRLRAGYLPVSCRTESGRSTFAWYRGPFVAEPAAPHTDRERRRCAAEALIHLQEYGVYDVSLATAFTAGRGVALSDHQFGAALLRLRGKVQRAVQQSAGAAGGARARVEHLAANGLAGHLGRALAAPARPRTTPAGSGAPAAAPSVTPVPAATDLPAPAGPAARQPRGGTPLVDPHDEDLALVRKRLTGLRNLEGVPFAHLVPDARMLPAESLRFFHVDADWTATLLDGALSVGLAHSFDLTSDALLLGPDGQAPLPVPAGPVTGLLLRSQLVAGWPALEVRPYASPTATGDDEQTLPVLRRQALADDVLLVLFEGVPGRVEITEPQQGVHFGIDEPADGRGADPLDDGVIRLRALTGDALGRETGAAFPADGSGLRSYLRATGAGHPGTVLSVARLAAALKGALALDHDLTPAEFALQMINAAQRRTFTTAPRTEHTPVTTGDTTDG
ncbi:hypothetical protein [Streptomyces sp. NPDC046261]|uniref:hypothetical protein n=1 Tax=Streptomyces sp. NPDC046261 TaxID=3157200 RepID=UPI0033F6117B